MPGFNLAPIKRSAFVFEPLFSEFPSILCLPRSYDTKTMHACDSLLREIAAGTFLASHNWSPSIRLKALSRLPGEALAVCTKEEALQRLRLSLQQLSKKMWLGCPYPPLKNGVRTKVALQSYLLLPGPTGANSPFLEFYAQALRSPDISIAECKSELGGNVASIVEEIAARRNRVVGDVFWKGAVDLLDWWSTIPDEVVYQSAASQLLFGRASALFRAVAEFQQSGGLIPDHFLNPTSCSWAASSIGSRRPSTYHWRDFFLNWHKGHPPSGGPLLSLRYDPIYSDTGLFCADAPLLHPAGVRHLDAGDLWC